MAPSGFKGDRIEPGPPTEVIHRPNNLDDLTAHLGVGLEWETGHCGSDRLSLSVYGELKHVRSQPLEFLALDPNMGAALATTDRVSECLQRHPPKVSDPASLLLKELVFAVCGQKYEEPAVPEVLDVRTPCAFASGAAPLGNVYLVALDELRINEGCILPVGNVPRDVEGVST